MSRLSGKVALITGGASGIGEGIVRRYGDEGASVVFTDIDADKGEALADATGACFLQQDVALDESWREVMAAVSQRFERLDAVVNNAGIVSNQSVDETEMDTWNRVVGVNLTGVMLGCKYGIERMRANPGGSCGSIINVASTTSFLGLAFDLAYTATKTGVVGLTKSVSTWCAENRLNIRCNSLHPGAVYTSILQSHVAQNPELFDVFSNMAPMGRMGTVEEVAGLALFLASDDSTFCTGGQFVADGGISTAHPSM